MKYQILSKNNKKLRMVAQPVEKFDSKLRRMIIDMSMLMKSEHGVGLAAPQIGVSERVIIVCIGNKIEPMINPEITWQSDETIVEAEGCLSVKGMVGKVKRCANIQVSYHDGHGVAKSNQLSNFEARIVQHEIDHLNGILYIDKLEA